MSDDVHEVIIIGGGIAGLFCALKLSPRPVTVLTAAPIGQGASSAWAQGGVAAAVADGDTTEAHARDTIAAGAGLVDEEMARAMTREAPDRVRDLLAYGVPFDQTLEGRLAVGREAAHSAWRIVHVRGDVAGRAIMDALATAVRNTPSIRLLECYVAEELVTTGPRVVGVRTRPKDGRELATLSTRAIVLATGGIGHLYAVTTNPPQACGIGLAIAARAGAVLADTEFVQFHPTAIATEHDPAPLASEALRGEGAILVNGAGEQFMLKIHPDGDLAPRDVVARGVFAEIEAGRGAFLDARSAIGTDFPERFPTVYASCVEAGIDPVRMPIPVAPAAHYHMGGVRTDARGRTSLAGLWAAGEVASTGVHGANRLASNSLLEAVVFASRVAEDISGMSSPSTVSQRTSTEPRLILVLHQPASATCARRCRNMSGSSATVTASRQHSRGSAVSNARRNRRRIATWPRPHCWSLPPRLHDARAAAPMSAATISGPIPLWRGGHFSRSLKPARWRPRRLTPAMHQFPPGDIS